MFGTIPPVTRLLLTTNVAVFIAQAFLDPLLVVWFALWPLSTIGHGVPSMPTGFLPWQIVTYSFLHGNALHLLVSSQRALGVLQTEAQQ